ncbi:bifunctional 5,10-methylenetetrahydrofolate dehydrogenase/5,10-methenyltetrahydrofolate cyclohydrolase [bacterium]|nr:bifunctional 5,10-methylenetetrahydrofolate dehydrogenase/5,10-methenyltetrahydrofolate cyclohydrolase [bacterium]
METQIIYGKEVAEWIQEDIRSRFDVFQARTGTVPGLAVVIVGEDPASQMYVKSKAKACIKMGFHSEVLECPETTTTPELLGIIAGLNHRADIHAILVQLPLPAAIDKTTVLDSIDPIKDVDGFLPVSTGRLVRGDYRWAACTPAGVMKIFEYLQYDVSGHEAVIIGRSDIVGKPMALLLMHAHATVTICHSRTRNLSEVARRADILISAMGKPGLVDASFCKEGACVIDIGTVRITPDQAWPELLEPESVWQKSFEKKGYATVGDVKFQQLLGKARYITPVPGGVGPLTITMLLDNTLKAAQLQAGFEEDELHVG